MKRRNSRTRARWLTALGMVVATALGANLPAGSASAPPPVHLGALEPGEGLVARSPLVEEAKVFWEACETMGPCFAYTVDVEAGGAVLRTLVDSADNYDIWGARLRSPDGRLVEMLNVEPQEIERSGLGTNAWTMELPRVEAPVAGRWEVLVVPIRVTDGAFRLRVQLDGTPPAQSGELRPNLRAVPPFHFTFAAPAQPARIPVTGNLVAPEPLVVADQRPVSCLPDESAEAGVTRCLRFGLGVANDGAGPLDLRFDRAAGSGMMSQHVRGSDITYDDGPRYEIHPTHAHFHNNDMASTDLLRVVPRGSGRRPALSTVHSSTKHGFCLDDSMLFEIAASKSDGRYAERSDCEVAPVDDVTAGDTSGSGRMVLTRGWVDIYPNYLNGMYVDFSSTGDGQYVLRTTVDPSDRVVESDDSDNVAYSWIAVTGDEVDVIERGWGMNPWDPHKVVIPESPFVVTVTGTAGTRRS